MFEIYLKSQSSDKDEDKRKIFVVINLKHH